jgi:ABC-type glycerol-3-phosphate transport system substrate-binding protein
MRIWNRIGAALAAAGLAAGAAPAPAAELVIWHDKGDAGIAMFREIGELYKQQAPDVTIRSLSFPTDQWFSRSIAAINTATGPDLLFNDNFRNAIIQQSTGKLRDMKADLEGLPPDARKAITAGDIEASLYKGQLVMLPTSAR